MLTQTFSFSAGSSRVILARCSLEAGARQSGGKTRPAILMLAGDVASADSEQAVERAAQAFCALGYEVFALHGPQGATAAPATALLLEGFTAIAWLRRHAGELGLDPERVVVCGIDAGGLLAKMLLTGWKDSTIGQAVGCTPQQARPDAGILLQLSHSLPTARPAPQFDPLEHVSAGTPPVFLWCASGDGRSTGAAAALTEATAFVAEAAAFAAEATAFVAEAAAFAAAMLQHGRPVELHVFGAYAQERSPDADSAGGQSSLHPAGQWPEQVQRWLGDVLNAPAGDAEEDASNTTGLGSGSRLDSKTGKPLQYYRNIFNDREGMFRHTPFSLEQELVRSVIKGDERAALATLTRIARLGNRAVLAKDPLRSAKNSMICFCTLLTRAVIQAGVSDEEAFALSDAAIQYVETLYDVDDVVVYQNPVVLQFIDLVKTRQDKNYSTTVQKALHYVACNLDKPFQLAAAARAAGVHPNYLSRRFKLETGATLSSYAATRKLHEAAYFVQHTDYSLAEIAALYGFSSQSHFSTTFKKVFLTSPGEYRSRAR